MVINNKVTSCSNANVIIITMITLQSGGREHSTSSGTETVHLLIIQSTEDKAAFCGHPVIYPRGPAPVFDAIRGFTLT